MRRIINAIQTAWLNYIGEQFEKGYNQARNKK